MREVRGLGTLTPEDIRWIPATTQGRVEKIILRPGTQVKANDVILELTNPTLEQQLQDAELKLAAAVAGLGVTLVSRQAVQRELDSGALVELDVPGTPLNRPWHIVTQSPCTGSTELLIGHLLAHRELGWQSAG